MHWLKLGLGIIAMSVAVAAGSEPYQPAGPWVLTGEDAQCKLSRQFQGKDGATKLTFEALPLDGAILVTIDSIGRRPDLGRSEAVFVASDLKKLHKVPMEWKLAADKVHRRGTVWLSRADFDDLSKSERLGLVERDWMAGFSLPNFTKAKDALLDCEWKVLRSVAPKLGFSADETGRMAQPAHLPMILRREAPAETQLPPGRELGDEVIAVYIVDPAGVMLGCAVVQRAKSEELNSNACQTWGNEPFVPAKDVDGRPVKGLAFERHGW